MSRMLPYWTTSFVLITAFLFSSTLPAFPEPQSNGMSFDLSTTDISCPECTTVYATGMIEGSSAKKLHDFLTRYSVPSGALIDLDSPGGSLLGGIELGRAIRSAGMRTSVGMKQPASERLCASACAYAFLGGVDRIVHPESGYGIHKFYGAVSPSDAMDLTQDIVADLLDYTSLMGASADVVKIASSTSANDMTWLDPEQRQTMRVVTEDFIDGGASWKTESLVMSGWQVQGTGRVVHFEFGCPQFLLSEREEAEIREKLATHHSWDPELNELYRNRDLQRLRWNDEYRLDIYYFDHRDQQLNVECSLSTGTGGQQCSMKGHFANLSPVQFRVDLPWSKFSGYHYDFNGISRIERNIVRLRTTVNKSDFGKFIDSSNSDAKFQIHLEPDVIFRGEDTIDHLSSEQMNFRFPIAGLAEAGAELIKQCERSRG